MLVLQCLMIEILFHIVAPLTDYCSLDEFTPEVRGSRPPNQFFSFAASNLSRSFFLLSAASSLSLSPCLLLCSWTIAWEFLLASSSKRGEVYFISNQFIAFLPSRFLPQYQWPCCLGQAWRWEMA
jgi:hypothetical protein